MPKKALELSKKKRLKRKPKGLFLLHQLNLNGALVAPFLFCRPLLRIRLSPMSKPEVSESDATL